MKRILTFIVISLILCSCVNQSDNSNITTKNFESSGESDITEYFSFSHGLKDESIKSFEYNGEVLEIEYSIANEGKDIELGIMVSINGIIQDFSVNTVKQTMYTVLVKKGETNDFTIKLEPNTGEKGKSYNMNFLAVFYPNKQPMQKEEYGNYHNISQSMKYRINYNSSAPIETLNQEIDYKKQEMSTTDLKKYIDESNDGQVANLLNSNTYCEIFQNGKQVDSLQKKTLTELKFCGIEGNYSVVEFNDMKPNNLGTLAIKKNTYSIVNHQIGNIKNYFVILIPLDEGDESLVMQSDRYIVL